MFSILSKNRPTLQENLYYDQITTIIWVALLLYLRIGVPIQSSVLIILLIVYVSRHVVNSSCLFTRRMQL